MQSEGKYPTQFPVNPNEKFAIRFHDYDTDLQQSLHLDLTSVVGDAGLKQFKLKMQPTNMSDVNQLWTYDATKNAIVSVARPDLVLSQEIGQSATSRLGYAVARPFNGEASQKMKFNGGQESNLSFQSGLRCLDKSPSAVWFRSCTDDAVPGRSWFLSLY